MSVLLPSTNYLKEGELNCNCWGCNLSLSWPREFLLLPSMLPLNILLSFTFKNS